MILEKNETFTVTEAMIPPQMSVTIDDAREAVRIFADLRMRYQGAIKEISTKLEVLDNEFSEARLQPDTPYDQPDQEC